MMRGTGLLVLIGVVLLSAWAAPAARAASADATVLATGPDETNADTNIAFSITVSNLGPDAAGSTTLTDLVPAGTTFVSFAQDSGPAFLCTSPAPGAAEGAEVSCSIASLAAAAEATFTLTVHVNAGTPPGTFISDTASVFTGTDPNSENDASTASTLVGPVTLADVGVTQSSPQRAGPDTNLSYSIAVTNGGPAAAAGATVTDTLPTGTTFVSLSTPAGWSCSTPAVGSGGAVTCSNSSLPLGSTASFSLVVHVPSATPSGTELLNRVTVSTSSSDPNEENDQATTSTVVGSADLGVTVTGPAAAMPGDTLTYTITLSNGGPDAANEVALTNPVPAHTTFASLVQDEGPAFALATPAAGATGSVTATRAQLASGQAAAAAFTLKVVVDPATADQTTITDTSTATSAVHDPDASDDSASAATAIARPATPTPTPTPTPGATATPAPPAVVTPPPATGGTRPKVVVCRKVPRLKGKTFSAAKRVLKRKRCKVGLRRRGPLRRKSGKRTKVRTQRPKPGATVYRGQKIRVTLR
jgi:uncharacterized repeat protein (TIGR01451 family)